MGIDDIEYTSKFFITEKKKTEFQNQLPENYLLNKIFLPSKEKNWFIKTESLWVDHIVLIPNRMQKLKDQQTESCSN